MGADRGVAPLPASWTCRSRNPRPALTPFVGALHEATGAAVRALLGLPSSVPVAWRLGRRDAVTLHVVVGDAEDRLEIDLGEGDGAAWFRGATFFARVRGADDADPLLRRLRRRLHAIDLAGAGGPWGAVAAAAAEERRYDGVRDTMFRDVSASEALVRLGFRCNQACDFCWQSRDWPEPPEALYATWVDEIAGAGIDTITFSGGEPTIHRSLLALVRRARAHGMRVVLQTNAVQLARPGFAAELASAGVVCLFVSFHSHLAAVSDAMTAAPRTHARTCAGIVEALRAGIAVHLNAVVERRNHDHLADHARFVVETFVAPFPDNPVACVEYSHPCQAYRQELWAGTSVPLDVIRPHLVAAMRVLGDAGVPVAGIGTCGFPPCLLRGTDLPIRRMDRAAENAGDVEGRLFVAACEGCALRSACLGLRREYIELHGGRGVVAFDEVPGTVIDG